MATYSTTLAPTNTSDATFRAWGSWISDRLTDIGWVKTADTGQIDWTTVLAPGVADTSQGYEIRQSNDGLTTTYLKIEFGSGSGATIPTVWTTLGYSTDGAGTLTGTPSDRVRHRITAASATLYNCYFSGTAARFTCAMFIVTATPASTYTMMFGVERSKDASGNDTSSGWLRFGIGWMTSGGASTTYGQAYYASTGDSTVETTYGALLPMFGTGSDGSNVALYPVFYNASGGPFKNPGLNILCAFNGDVTVPNTIAVTMYGTAHTYLCLGASAPDQTRGTIAQPVGVIVRYE